MCIYLVYMVIPLRPWLVVYGVRVQNTLFFAYPYSVHVFCIATHTEYVYKYEITFVRNFLCSSYTWEKCTEFHFLGN